MMILYTFPFPGLQALLILCFSFQHDLMLRLMWLDIMLPTQFIIFHFVHSHILIAAMHHCEDRTETKGLTKPVQIGQRSGWGRCISRRCIPHIQGVAANRPPR